MKFPETSGGPVKSVFYKIQKYNLHLSFHCLTSALCSLPEAIWNVSLYILFSKISNLVSNMINVDKSNPRRQSSLGVLNNS